MGLDAQQMLMQMRSFLFVCYGNICRSPALQGCLEKKLEDIGIHALVESCGIAAQEGHPPDPHMKAIASQGGVTLKASSKRFHESDFERFDQIFCISNEISEAVKALTPIEFQKEKVMLATHFSTGRPIPDPYRLSKDGFLQVWGSIQLACQGIIDHYYPLN